MKTFKEFEIKKLNVKDENCLDLLKNIKNAPTDLYFRGEMDTNLFDKSLAVVGSRRMTSYGKQVLDTFIPDLVSEGVTIISGFMYGVDTYAHELTVECGGRTVAVLGNGLDVVYPVENEKLYNDILVNKGVVMSEYEAESKPHPWKYPKRNRIVSALASLGVLVIEASLGSGSLITAKLAKSQGKKVFAVPGMINSKVSMGTNNLISEGGATLVTSAADIVRIKRGKSEKAQAESIYKSKDRLENKIISILSDEALNMDEIMMQVNENISVVGAKIMTMSIKGIINEKGGKFYLSK